MIYDFLEKLTLRNKNYDTELRISGKLWIRDLFMKAQAFIPQLKKSIRDLTVIIIVASYLVTTLIIDWKKDDWEGYAERNTDKTASFWVYNATCFVVTFLMLFLNNNFLFFAAYDSSRRIYMMRILSNSLELDFNTKSSTTI